MNKFKNEWQKLVNDYSRKLADIDKPYETEAERQQAIRNAGEAARKLSEYGYCMAHDLDNVQDDLYTKWWFKLFTKLQL